jgi:hypothetical protein
MDQISDHLISVGKTLADASLEKKIHLGDLKQLKYSIERTFSSKFYDHKTRCFGFLIANFLGDLFYNLVGDFPFDDSYGNSVHLVRKTFFKVLGEDLYEIGKALEGNDTNLAFQCLTNMVAKYLDTIDEINETINVDS